MSADAEPSNGPAVERPKGWERPRGNDPWLNPVTVYILGFGVVGLAWATWRHDAPLTTFLVAMGAGALASGLFMALRRKPA